VENEPNGVIVEEPQTVETSFMNGNLHKNEQEIPKPVKDPVKRLSIDGQITSKISKNKVRMY
jgi:plastocyanin domain-containing protein